MSAVRGDARHCFVCGPDNPIGLKLDFTVEGERCHGEFTSAAEHAGFDGVTHGGIVFSVLDDAMANWFFCPRNTPRAVTSSHCAACPI